MFRLFCERVSREERSKAPSLPPYSSRTLGRGAGIVLPGCSSGIFQLSPYLQVSVHPALAVFFPKDWKILFLGLET